MAEHVPNELLRCEYEGCGRDLKGKAGLSRHMKSCAFGKVKDDKDGEDERDCRNAEEEEVVGEPPEDKEREARAPSPEKEKPSGKDVKEDVKEDAHPPTQKKGTWTHKHKSDSPLVKRLNTEGREISQTGPRKLLIPETNPDESWDTEEEDGDQVTAAAAAVVGTAQGTKELPPSLYGTMTKINPFASSQAISMDAMGADMLGEDASQAEFQRFMMEKMSMITDNMTEMATKRDLVDYAEKVERVSSEAREALEIANTAAERYDRLEDFAVKLEEKLVRVERIARGGMNDSYITAAQASAKAQEVVLEMKRKERNLVIKGVSEQEEESPQKLQENVAIWLADKMRPVYDNSFKDKLEYIMWDQIEFVKRQGPFNALRKFPRDVVVTLFHKRNQERILTDFIPVRNGRIKAWEEYKSLPREEKDKRDPPSFFDIVEDHPNYLRNRGNEIKDIAKVAGCHRTLKKPGKLGAVQLPRGDFRLALLEVKREGFAEIQSEEDTMAEVREILIKAGEARGWDLKGSRASTKLGEHMPRVMPQELRVHRPLIAMARDVERWRSGNNTNPQGMRQQESQPQDPTRRSTLRQESSRRTPQQQKTLEEVQDKLLQLSGAHGVGDDDKSSQKNMSV